MDLNLTVDTPRAILHAAQTFSHPHQVIWEYVVNEIQYRDKKINAKIFVDLNADSIVIRGNGSGMDEKDLKHFFTLHAENRERKKGNPGRGKFGTGKSAAFAIAREFVITTYKNKKEYKIKINYNNLKKLVGTGKDISLSKYILVHGKSTKNPNGTIIEINQFFKGTKIVKKEIINYIEKHLKYFKGSEVWVNDHQCEVKEPEIKETHKFNSKKCGIEGVGDIDLIIKVSSEPLEKHDQGIAVSSNNTPHEYTLAGSENREMSNHIFGEIECPLLDDENMEIAAFSMSRNMILNPQNPVVRKIYTFIGLKVEEVRKALVESENKKKKTEEAKKLQKQADDMASKINNHLQNYLDKIKMKFIRKSDGLTGMVASTNSGNKDANGSLDFGNTINAILQIEKNILPGESSDGDSNNELRTDKRNKYNNLLENKKEKKIGKKVNGGGKNQSSGGRKFRVEYADHGSKNARARFVPDENTVYINLENPYIASLRSEDISKKSLFTKISYEVAFTEYAMGLVRLLYNNRYFKDNTEEYLMEVRKIVNDLSNPSEI